MKNIETERKYLIRMPSDELLSRCERSEIVQTYLRLPENGGARVRARTGKNGCVYTKTVKKRITEISRIELEDEIDRETYLELLRFADPDRRAVEKTRYILSYKAQNFEIDVYPFWRDRAIMELELETEDQRISFPPDISVIREVSTEKAYSNSSLAREIPDENI